MLLACLESAASHNSGLAGSPASKCLPDGSPPWCFSLVYMAELARHADVGSHQSSISIGIRAPALVSHGYPIIDAMFWQASTSLDYDIESASGLVDSEVLTPFQMLRACRPSAAVAEQAETLMAITPPVEQLRTALAFCQSLGPGMAEEGGWSVALPPAVASMYA